MGVWDDRQGAGRWQVTGVLPWSAQWMADWGRLTPEQRMGLECMYDYSIPHQAILDELRLRPPPNDQEK